MPKLRCHYVDCIYLEGDYAEHPQLKSILMKAALTYTHITDGSPEFDWDEETIDESWEDEPSEKLYEEDWEEE